MQRIAIVDPNQLFRDGIRHLLLANGFEVPAEGRRLADLGAAEFDLVLIDLQEAGDEMARVTELRRAGDGPRVAALSAEPSPALLSRFISAGGDAWLLKEMSGAALVQALRLVLLGEQVFPTRLALMVATGQSAARSVSAGFTQRETVILGALVEGCSNKAIARRLGIAEPTVKSHLKSLLKKLGVNNRTQAAIWAMNNGFVRPEPAASLAPASA